MWTKRDLPRQLLLVFPSLWWAPADPHLHRRPSNTSRWFWFSFLWSHCSFLLSLGAHKVLFVPSKPGVSVSPTLMEVLWSNPTVLQDQIPWGFPVPLLGPRAGKPDMGSKPSQQWDTFFCIIVLQFVDHPPGGDGIWFYHDCAPPTVSLQLLLCLWMWGIIFLVGSSILLSMAVQQLVVILVLSQEEMSACPSTLPSWTRSISF